jgi:uncharacterized membrane protein
MAAEQDRRTERGFDRFVNFSDAVVAIAISLLILPLVDAANDGITGDTTALDFVQENGDRLLAFGLSFVVIASYWVAHHAVFEEVRTYSAPLMWWNLAWLATIVFLPLPTEVLAVHGAEEAFVRFFYIGSVFVTSLTLIGLELTIDRNPDVRRDPAAHRPRPISRLASAFMLLTALLVGTFVPAIGLWAMFLTILSGPLANRLDRRA